MKADQLLRNGTEVGLHLLLVLSPIFFGAVSDWAYLPARALILLLVGLSVLRLVICRRVRPVWTWFSLPAALFLAYVLFSVFLLPGSVLKMLSPVASARYQDVLQWREELERSLLSPLRAYVVGTNEGAPAASVPSTLSVDPWRTRQASLSLLTPLLLFFVAANLGGSRSQSRRLIASLAGTTGLISAYGLYQAFTGAFHVLWAPRWAGGRVSGTFINSNHFALYLEMALPLTFALLVSFFLADRPAEARDWREALGRIRQGGRARVVLVSLAFALGLLAFLYTQSRMGIASLLLVTICGIPFLLRKRRVFGSASVILAFLGFLGLAALWVGIDRPMRRLLPVSLQSPLKDFRLQVWSDARAWRGDFFLTGSGLGTFEVVYPRYQTIGSLLKFRNAHNDLLEAWTETGAVGLGLVLSGIGALFWQMFRLRRRREDPFVRVFTGAAIIGLGSALLHSVGGFGLRMPANAYLFALTAGLAIGLLHRPRFPLRAERRQGGPFSRKGFRVVCCGLAGIVLLALIWDTATTFRNSLRFRTAARRSFPGRLGLQERRALLQEAVSVQPQDETYMLALLSAEELRMRLDQLREPEEGLRSALRTLELAGRAQLLHPASGNMIFAEAVILSNLDRWMVRRNALLSSGSLGGGEEAAQGRGREFAETVRRLREPVARLAWKTLTRALTWEPRRFAFHYALALHGVFRWESLDEGGRRQVKASIAKAADLLACPHPSPFRDEYPEERGVLERIARHLGDKALLEKVQRACCPQGGENRGIDLRGSRPGSGKGSEGRAGHGFSLEPSERNS